MRNTILKALLGTAVIILVVTVINVRADVRFGLSANESGLNGFYMFVSEYNRVPQEEVIFLKSYGITDEELPVVFFLSSKAGVRPETVIKFRQRGFSWMKTALKLNLHPGIFYSGRMHNRYALSDFEIVRLINTRAISDYHGCHPEMIDKMRDNHMTFREIDRDLREKARTVYKYKINEKKRKK